MKKALRFFLATYVSLFAHSALAQGLFVDNDKEFEYFDYNIKQINEFILRFNLKELLIQPEQSNNFKRDNRILLFDKEYYLNNTDKLNNFLSAAEKQNTILSFYDSTWFAIAKCNVTFQGMKEQVTLLLRTEQVKDDIYKWSIMDAHGRILELAPKSQSDRIRLLPTDNEVNFIALQSVTTANAPNISLFNVKSHINDRLSVFNCLVYNKLLKIDNVQDLTYCFTQVDGYKFYVKNFPRNQKNAGWLIFNVEREQNMAPEKNSLTDSTKLISELYQMLSDYARDPSNISLAKTIQSRFVKKTKELYFFGANNIYDDIEVFSRKYSPQYAYVTISDYLNSVYNITQAGIALSYAISDITIDELGGSKISATYKVSMYNMDSVIYDYYAKALIQDGLLVSIILAE